MYCHRLRIYILYRLQPKTHTDTHTLQTHPVGPFYTSYCFQSYSAAVVSRSEKFCEATVESANFTSDPLLLPSLTSAYTPI